MPAKARNATGGPATKDGEAHRTGAGIKQLLNAVEHLMPNPQEGNPPRFLKGEGKDAEEVSIAIDPDAHVIAHVFMVNIDPFKGRMGTFRVHQGTITSDTSFSSEIARKPVKVPSLPEDQRRRAHICRHRRAW